MASKYDAKTIDLIMDRLSRIEEKVDSQGQQPHEKAAELSTWLPEAFHNQGTIGGIVVDEGRARQSDCKCIPLGKDSHLCYSEGVVGALSREQEKLYCDSRTIVEASPELVTRTNILKDSAIACQGVVSNIPAEERLEPFMQCMVSTAKEKGLVI